MDSVITRAFMPNQCIHVNWINMEKKAKFNQLWNNIIYYPIIILFIIYYTLWPIWSKWCVYVPPYFGLNQLSSGGISTSIQSLSLFLHSESNSSHTRDNSVPYLMSTSQLVLQPYLLSKGRNYRVGRTGLRCTLSLHSFDSKGNNIARFRNSLTFVITYIIIFYFIG